MKNISFTYVSKYDSDLRAFLSQVHNIKTNSDANDSYFTK